MSASSLIPYQPKRPPARATAREFAAFIRRSRSLPTAQQAAVEPRRGMVLVIPCLLHSDRQTARLRQTLCNHRYAAAGWGLGVDIGPTRRLLDGAQARLRDLAAEHGPITVIGFSMGGLFARWLALQAPAAVKQVITVCSPFRAAPDSCFLPLRFGLSRWPGVDLTQLAADIERPLPVPTTSIYSRNDGIVAGESCHDPSRPGDSFAIEGPHVTITNDPAVLSILLNRLGSTRC